MLELDPAMQKLLAGLVGGILTGVVGWAALSARRAFRNVGRTELELALEDLKTALEEERLAAATADPDDDKAAADHKRRAQANVTAKKRLKALLDAAGEE